MAHAVIATLNGANRIIADVYASFARGKAPTSSAKAFTLDTHAMGRAIWLVIELIEVRTMFLLTVLSVPIEGTIACANRAIPISIRWSIAIGMQSDAWFWLRSFLLYNLLGATSTTITASTSASIASTSGGRGGRGISIVGISTVIVAVHQAKTWTAYTAWTATSTSTCTATAATFLATCTTFLLESHLCRARRTSTETDT